MTPYTGTRLRFSLDQYWPSGTAPSRLKAKSMRMVLVIQATVQKNCPAVEMNSTMLAQLVVRDWLKITATAPPALVTPASSCTAKRKLSRTTQPAMPE